MTTSTLAFRRAALAAILACATAGCGVLRPAQPAPRASLGATIDSIIAQPPLQRTHWGIYAVEAATGRVLYAHDADQHFIPASNTKLVATTTAMALLGPGYRYHTQLYAAGSGARPGTVRSLVLVAHGDPTWSSTFQPTDFSVLGALADSVRAAGIQRVDGDLVVDASAFEPTVVNPAWEVGDLVYYYSAPIDALAIGEGTMRLVLLPSYVQGTPAAVRFLGPEPEGPVVNHTRTAPPGGRVRFDADRRAGVDTLYLTGTVPLGAPADTETLAVVDPAVYAARAFQAELERRGVTLNGTVRVTHDSAEASALLQLPPTRRIGTWTSPPLKDIVAALLKPSDNWLAETVLKTIGAEKAGHGSWRDGIRVEYGFLADEVGIDSTAVHLRDGSGLSAQNLLTPQAIVKLLTYAQRAPWGADYRAALAEPGEKGTLSHRLTAYKGRLHAKTGTIANVNSLSGYLRTDDGRDLVFSILTNGSGLPSSRVRAAMDRIVTLLAQSGGAR